MNPWKNQKTGVVDHKMQVVLSGLRVPADKIVSGFDFPGGRTPAQAGNRSITDKGDVLKMIADDLTIAQVMVLSCPVRKKEKLN